MLLHNHTLFAVAEAESGVLGVLGIDWQLLVLQALAFLLLLWFLAKYVYPHLSKALDERQKAIEVGAEAAAKAEANAKIAQEKIQESITEARKEAEQIIASAQKEAVAIVDDAQQKASKRAEHIVSEAHEQLAQDVSAARKVLQKDTVELVALATEKILRQKVDTTADKRLIEDALKELG